MSNDCKLHFGGHYIGDATVKITAQTCATCVYFVPCNQDKKSGGCFGPIEKWVIKPDNAACEEYQGKETTNGTQG